ncbi:peptidoglycan-binding domain-containing protein [uncultured Ruminococcus sp.]|uniref:peptidoglycan-binding domain-containing protein n=1 Tax=uncultured Ruminococcus sp. TaxID=165186 RepID=UPI002594C02C|nr:peptidoglycan-binding domain-containing protein [uncultured Ruminococcus sp.]
MTPSMYRLMVCRQLGWNSPPRMAEDSRRKTIAAIRAYQQEHGLAVDGLAGKKTVAALKGATT